MATYDEVSDTDMGRHMVLPGKGFVEKDDRRISGQRAGNFGATPFPARQRQRGGVTQPCEPEFVEQLFQPAGAGIGIRL